MGGCTAGVRSIIQAPSQKLQDLQQAEGLTQRQKHCVPEWAPTTQLAPHRQVLSFLGITQSHPTAVRLRVLSSPWHVSVWPLCDGCREDWRDSIPCLPFSSIRLGVMYHSELEIECPCYWIC